MHNQQRVIVAVDHTENSKPAARLGARLAKELEASVTIVHVVEPIPTTLLEPVDARVHTSQVEWAEEQLAVAAGEVFDACDAETKLVDSGKPAAEGICEIADELNASLIVMGTHGRTTVEHALFGSTATSVVRHAGCDVLSVRPSDRAAALRKIVVAVDFSAGSKLALKRAGWICRHFPAEIHAIHAVATPFWPLAEPVDNAPQVEKAKTALNEALEEAHIALPHVYVAEGEPSARIIELANQIEADLVLMGTRGLTGVKRWAIGSVAERVVRASATPVWCVRQ